jgi:hypothetical protein
MVAAHCDSLLVFSFMVYGIFWAYADTLHSTLHYTNILQGLQ